jgi:meiotically up-regulated gene 157 (Mug157) protein
LKYTFINSFPNTLDTTVSNYDPTIPDAFVITGDITAMWLRDSTNQLWTYMEFVNDDSNLQNLIKGVINR